MLSLGVPIGLFLMMYPAMTNVRLTEVGQAFRSPKGVRRWWDVSLKSRR